jgi:hypothetical protein
VPAPVPARIRVKLLASGALTVGAVLADAPAVTVVALAATCAAIPLAAAAHGGTALLRAVLVPGTQHARTDNTSGRPTHGSDDPADAAAADAR